jgi:hypothetical protein
MVEEAAASTAYSVRATRSQHMRHVPWHGICDYDEGTELQNGTIV